MPSSYQIFARAFNEEIQALQSSRHALGQQIEPIEQIGALLRDRRGSNKIIVSGIGKCSHVAAKWVATFNSLGQTAVQLNATDAFHGDLGICSTNDLLFCLSNSGETAEMAALAEYVKLLNVTTVAVTANVNSRLARVCDHRLLYSITREACTLGLAPTSSTTVMFALGDALAVTAATEAGFSKDSFMRFHPRGSLSKQKPITSLMRTGPQLTLLPRSVTLRETLAGVTDSHSGIAIFLNEDSSLAGILTDGDLRRCVLQGCQLDNSIHEYINEEPVRLESTASVLDASHLLVTSKVSYLIVVDCDNQVLGCLDEKDLR